MTMTFLCDEPETSSPEARSEFLPPVLMKSTLARAGALEV